MASHRLAKAGPPSKHRNIVAVAARQEDTTARRVIDNIRDIADQLRDQGEEAERIGRLPDDTAKLLKAAGPIKLLQPKQYGGFEAHPREFAETVMAVASLDGAAGWICGVVGVHPWQLAFADPKVREEVWGTDDNTWMASPYAPTGLAVPTDGGYTINHTRQDSCCVCSL